MRGRGQYYFTGHTTNGGRYKYNDQPVAQFGWTTTRAPRPLDTSPKLPPNALWASSIKVAPRRVPDLPKSFVFFYINWSHKESRLEAQFGATVLACTVTKRRTRPKQPKPPKLWFKKVVPRAASGHPKKENQGRPQYISKGGPSPPRPTSFFLAFRIVSSFHLGTPS